MAEHDHFIFPDTIPKLDYGDRIPASARTSRRVHVESVVTRYVTAMSSGMEFQRFVESETNRSSPLHLLRANFEALKQISSQGWSWSDVESLIGSSVPELQTVPASYDILDSAEHDAACLDALVRIDRVRGFSIANTTKLLHQKRPYAIPILDSYARMALGVHWVRGEGDGPNRRVYALGLDACRRAHNHDGNAAAITLAAHVYGFRCDGPVPARLRLMDILAWGAVESGALPSVRARRTARDVPSAHSAQAATRPATDLQ